MFVEWPDGPKNHPCPDCSAQAGEPCVLKPPGPTSSGFVHVRRYYTPESNEAVRRYYEREAAERPSDSRTRR